jgi:DNA-binding Lrp family transcriptional regulator
MSEYVKLSACERDLLATCGNYADGSLTEFSRICGHTVHKTRYALERLIERGAAVQIWVADVYRLDWHRFAFYCSLEGCPPERRRAFVNAAIKSDNVAYLCEMAGDYEYELSLLAGSPAGALDVLSRIVTASKVRFFRKELAVRTHIALFPRKYLSSREPVVSKLEYGSTSKRFDADSLDHSILREMSHGGRRTLQEIATLLKHPRSTIERRVKRMTDEKVIVGSMFSTRPSVYGSRSYKFLVLTRGLGDDTANMLSAFTERSPHCTYIHHLFGTWDYEVGVEAARYEDVSLCRTQISELLGPRILEVRMLERGVVRKYHSYPLAPLTIRLSA